MQRSDHNSAGMTLPELLVALVLLGLLAALGMAATSRSLAQQRLDAAARLLAAGLEQARSGAEANGQPCGLHLGDQGWTAPLADGLPPCRLDPSAVIEGVTLRHNLSGDLRIASNGLVLDGGTLVLGAPGTTLQRCLVVSLPLGVVRAGRSTAAPGAVPRSSDCSADPLL